MKTEKEMIEGIAAEMIREIKAKTSEELTIVDILVYEGLTGLRFEGIV